MKSAMYICFFEQNRAFTITVTQCENDGHAGAFDIARTSSRRGTSTAARQPPEPAPNPREALSCQGFRSANDASVQAR